MINTNILLVVIIHPKWEKQEMIQNSYKIVLTHNHSSSILYSIAYNHCCTLHFELKPQIIHLLPTFHGLDREDPYMHVKDFLEICATCKFQNFTNVSICLHLFSFSLRDKAKAWLNSLSPYRNFW